MAWDRGDSGMAIGGIGGVSFFVCGLRGIAFVDSGGWHWRSQGNAFLLVDWRGWQWSRVGGFWRKASAVVAEERCWHQGDSIGVFGRIAPVDTGRSWKFHRHAEVTGEAPYSSSQEQRRRIGSVVFSISK